MTNEKYNKGIKKRAAKGVMWATLENAGVRAVTLLAFLVLARILDKEAFGLVALALAYIAFLELVVRVGVTEVIVQRRELTELHKDTAYWTSAGLGMVALVLSYLAAPFAAKWSGQPELEKILYWLALMIIPLSLTRVQQGILMRELKFRSLAIRRLLGSVCGAVVGISCALKGYGVWSLVAQQLTDRLVDFFTLYWVTHWLPRFRFSTVCLRDMADYAWKIMGINIVTYAGAQADRLLIGHFLGVAALGVYVVGRRIIEVLLGVATSVIGRVALSAFSMVQTDHRALQKGSLAVMRICATLGFPVFMFLIVAGDKVNLLLFGTKWVDSGLIVQIMAAAALIRMGFIFAAPLLKARGIPGRVLIAATSQAFVSIGLAIAMSPMGLNAMAAGWAVGEVVSATILWIWVRRVAKVSMGDMVNVLSGPFLGAMGGALLVLLQDSMLSLASIHTWVEVSVNLLIFMAGYVLILRIIAPLTISKILSDFSVVMQRNRFGNGA